MAKGQPLSRHQQGIVKRYYDNQDTIRSNRLSELVSDLYLCEDAKKAGKLWERVATALAGTATDPARAAKIVKTQDIQELARLAGELAIGTPKPGSAPTSRPTAPPTQPSAPATPASASSKAASPGALPGALPGAKAEAGAISPDDLKAAMRAFKKRLKLKRLDDESKIGRSPLTSGSQSELIAIQPPRDYPLAVWEELVKQGRLKRMGPGFYAMA